MKKIIASILYILVLLIIMSACKVDNNSKDQETVASYLPTNFENENDFVNQIKESKQKGTKDRAALNDVEYYFRLKQIPEGAHLQEIMVNPTYVMLFYIFDDIQDQDGEIVLTWKRTLTGQENIDDMLKRINSDYKRVEEDSREYIVTEVTRSERDEKGEDIKGTSEVVRKMIYWTQDGYAFDTAFPIWYTEEEMLEILQVEKVNIE